MADPAVNFAPDAVVARLRAAGCVFAEDEAALLASAATSDAELESMVARRVAGLPLEHVIGWADFCGQRIAVDAGVFVPRHRSELLVRETAARCLPGRVLVDLCCGSGAVGVAVAAVVGCLEVHAVDIEPAAVRCARRNLEGIGGHAYDGDLYAPLPARLRGRVDVIVANAPYVPTSDIPLLPREARLYEPSIALDGGPDGLDPVRRVVAGAAEWLAPGDISSSRPAKPKWQRRWRSSATRGCAHERRATRTSRRRSSPAPCRVGIRPPATR